MIASTDRLYFREFQEDDWEEVFQYTSDIDVIKYVHWGPYTLEEAKDYVDNIIASQRENPRRIYKYAIVEKSSGRLIGDCDLYCTEVGESAALTITLNKNCWGRGYATEIGKTLLQHGFDDLGLKSITATAHPQNVGSIKFLENIGMKEKEYLTDHANVKGRLMDSVIYEAKNPELVG